MAADSKGSLMYMGCIRCGFLTGGGTDIRVLPRFCPDCGDPLCGLLNPRVLTSGGGGKLQKKYRVEHGLPPLKTPAKNSKRAKRP